MVKPKGNSGAGFIVRDYKSRRWPEGTLRSCGGWYESNPAHPMAVGGCGFYTGKRERGPVPYLRNACLNFLQVAQWPVVLDFFAESAYQSIRKSKTDFSAVAALPGEEAFGDAVAHWGKRGIIYTERTDMRDTGETMCFRLRNDIGKGEKVLVALGTLTDLSRMGTFAEMIADAGGKIAGVVCAVNDTFPLVEEFVPFSGKKPVPIFSVVAPEIPRYRQSASEVAEAVRLQNVIMDPYEPESWNELIGSMGKRGRKD